MIYQTKQSDSIATFDNMVTTALKRGWELYGQPYTVTKPSLDPDYCSASGTSGRTIYCQAVVYRDEK